MSLFFNRKGFTLIELIIGLAIIAIIASAAFPRIAAYQESNREKEQKNQNYLANKALKQYYAFTGDYPDCVHNAGGVIDPVDANGTQKLKSQLLKKTGIQIDIDRFTYTISKYDDDGDICEVAVTFK